MSPDADAKTLGANVGSVLWSEAHKALLGAVHGELVRSAPYYVRDAVQPDVLSEPGQAGLSARC